MTLRAYKKKVERRKRRRKFSFKRKYKKKSGYRRRNVVRKSNKNKLRKNKVIKLSIRHKKRRTKKTIIHPRFRKFKFRLYVRRLLKRRYRRKKIRYKIRFKRTRKIKNIVRKFLGYSDLINQPLRAVKKIAYVLSYFKIHGYYYMFDKESDNFARYIQMAAKKSVGSLEKKTYNFNRRRVCLIKKKHFFKSKNNFIHVKKQNPVLYAKNVLWKHFCRMMRRVLKYRKIMRRLKFSLRLLYKDYRYKNSRKKYRSRYRRSIYKKKHLLKKKKKKYIKIRIKLKKKIKKIKFTKGRVTDKKYIKTKRLIKILRKSKRILYKRNRKLKYMLHNLKYNLLGVNDVLKRKKRRKFYWLTYLPFYKSDIKLSYCLSLAYNPLYLKILTHTLKNKKQLC